jgi:hypothetical protein
MLADRYPSQHLVQVLHDFASRIASKFTFSAKVFSKRNPKLIQASLPFLLHGFRDNDGFYTAHCGKL